MIKQSPSFRGIGMTSERTRKRLLERLKVQGITNQAVLDAMQATPRHLFVDEALAHRAYEDFSLPIGFGQTISQPYIVAKMSEMVHQVPNVKRVLEIGTGSGYQAAVLSQLVERVCSVERVTELFETAKSRFLKYGYRNIDTLCGDGTLGWQEKGPFDVILSTASTPRIPPALTEQLKMYGYLILPLGEGDDQKLSCVQKCPDGLQLDVIEQVKFVPLISGT